MQSGTTLKIHADLRRSRSTQIGFVLERARRAEWWTTSKSRERRGVVCVRGGAHVLDGQEALRRHVADAQPDPPCARRRGGDRMRLLLCASKLNHATNDKRRPLRRGSLVTVIDQLTKLWLIAGRALGQAHHDARRPLSWAHRGTHQGASRLIRSIPSVLPPLHHTTRLASRRRRCRSPSRRARHVATGP